MLEQVDVDKKMSKDEYEKKMESLSTRLGELQRKCKEQKIPVMVTFDGVDAAGKGTMINRVIQFLDPRGYRVFTTGCISLTKAGIVGCTKEKFGKKMPQSLRKCSYRTAH